MADETEVKEETILRSTKKLLGIGSDYNYFDTDILMHINSVFSILTQLGVGSEEGFCVETDSTWTDFLEEDPRLEMIKSYVYLKVRLLFDPPTGGVKEAMTENISELEWRILVAVDPMEDGEE